MTERQKRLHEVYEHVRKFYGIHTQIDFAEALHKSRNSITLALNGNEAYLTKKLFENICACWPGVFDLNYLLTGDGHLLTLEEEVNNERIEKAASPAVTEPAASVPDMSSVFNAALAAKDDAIESLKRELSTKDDLIQSLRDQLAAKDQLIAEQKARLIDYRRIIDSHDGLDRYPFPIGAADGSSKQKRTQK